MFSSLTSVTYTHCTCVKSLKYYKQHKFGRLNMAKDSPPEQETQQNYWVLSTYLSN